MPLPPLHASFRRVDDAARVIFLVIVDVRTNRKDD